MKPTDAIEAAPEMLRLLSAAVESLKILVEDRDPDGEFTKLVIREIKEIDELIAKIRGRSA